MNRLKKLRKGKGDTLHSLSLELKKRGVNLSTGQLSSYENGKRSPRKKVVWEKLADYFGVPVEYLLGYDTKVLDDIKRINKASLEHFSGIRTDIEVVKKAWDTLQEVSVNISRKLMVLSELEQLNDKERENISELLQLYQGYISELKEASKTLQEIQEEDKKRNSSASQD